MTTAASATAAGLRRTRGWVLLAALVVVVALVTAYVSASRGAANRLDPTNPAPAGARAAASILTDQGVRTVRITRSSELAEQAAGGATVVVTDTQTLGPAQLDRLSRTTGPLVLIEPDDRTLVRLAPSLAAGDQVEPVVVAPQCADPAARAAGSALAGGFSYRRGEVRQRSAPVFCYPAAGARGGGSYAVTSSNGRRVTVIGQGDLLINENLAAEGNAALALRTLGSAPTLVWYLPDPLEADTGGEPATILSLVPDWVRWAVLQLLVAVLLAMLWRGRRLGKLVAEPLPVVVRAAETQLGRARLYRQARARGRAGDTLRTAALRRLATRLPAPDGATPAHVADLVAASIGAHPQEVGQVLMGPAPATDAELIRLADRLDELEHAAATSGERRS
jgi:hypothetical protein